MRTAHGLALVLLLSAPLAGCKQGINDRCQIDSDCAGGSDTPPTTYCAIPGSATRAEGGTCQSRSGGVVPDAALDTGGNTPDAVTAPPDLSTRDLSPAPAPDLTVADAQPDTGGGG